VLLEIGNRLFSGGPEVSSLPRLSMSEPQEVAKREKVIDRRGDSHFRSLFVNSDTKTTVWHWRRPEGRSGTRSPPGNSLETEGGLILDDY